MSSEVLIDIIATKIYPAVLVLFFFGLTIFIHELGHFWMAKRRKMKIERFSVGFGPKMFGWKKDGIDYRVSWIPFGGYVALPQMSPMETIEGKTETTAAQLPPASPLSKILVAFAGPIMNIFLAIALAYLVYWIGLPTPINPSVVGWVDPSSREAALGIQAGDRIVKIDGKEVETWMEVQRAVALSLESSLTVTLERDGVQSEHLLEAELHDTIGLKTLNLFSEGHPLAGAVARGSAAETAGILTGDQFLSVDGVEVNTREEVIKHIKNKPLQEVTIRVMRGEEVITVIAIPQPVPGTDIARIGVELTEKLEYRMVRPGPTPTEQFRDIYEMMRDTFYALAHHKETGVGARSLSGPVGIMGGWWHEIKNGGIMRGVWFAVLLNLNLAILNLLPLPVLDGGHIVFALIEGTFRRPLSPRIVQGLSVAFAVLLISFMLYVTFFDFKRFIGFPQFGTQPPPEEILPEEPAAPALVDPAEPLPATP